MFVKLISTHVRLWGMHRPKWDWVHKIVIQHIQSTDETDIIMINFDANQRQLIFQQIPVVSSFQVCFHCSPGVKATKGICLSIWYSHHHLNAIPIKCKLRLQCGLLACYLLSAYLASVCEWPRVSALWIVSIKIYSAPTSSLIIAYPPPLKLHT